MLAIFPKPLILRAHCARKIKGLGKMASMLLVVGRRTALQHNELGEPKVLRSQNFFTRGG